MDGKLIISEVFGPTFQGEGPSVGRRAAFVRLGRCNLDCRWCDTSYTWDWHGKNGTIYDAAIELSADTVDNVVKQVEAMDVPLVVITGGEPLLQHNARLLVEQLTPHHDVEIETNGTRTPDGHWYCHFNVSPKLSSSGVPRDKAWLDEPIKHFIYNTDSVFKFVIGTGPDVDDMRDFVERYDIPARRVWLMPQTAMNGVEPALTPIGVATLATKLGTNFSGRLHVDLWGNERGH